MRQVRRGEVELEVAAVGDRQRVGQRLRPGGELPRHLLRRAEVEVGGAVAQPLRVVHRHAGLDAEQDLVRIGVLLAEVMDVVTADQRQVQLPGDPDQLRIDR